MKMSSVKASYVYGLLVVDSYWKITFLLISVNLVASQPTKCHKNLHIKPSDAEDFYWDYRGLHLHTWCFSTEQGAELTLECPEVEMKKFTEMCRDTLNVSVTGNLHDAEVFCDRFQVTGKSIIMKLLSIDGQGTIRCKVKAKRESSCRCGYSGLKKAERIVQGTPAGVHEFTSFGGLFHVKAKKVVCGSTIISNRLALTAAHCVVTVEQDKRPPRAFLLLLGGYELPKGNDTGSARKYRIERFVPRADYIRVNKSSTPYDIAIIETSEEMRFDQNVGPACLPFKFSDPVYDKSVTIVGWGRTEFNGSRPDVLQKASVSILRPSVCKNLLRNTTYSEEKQICIYGNGRAYCHADSGGPLYYKDPDTGALFVIGVISRSNHCSAHLKHPSISIRVHSYLTWIQNMYPGETFCHK